MQTTGNEHAQTPQAGAHRRLGCCRELGLQSVERNLVDRRFSFAYELTFTGIYTNIRQRVPSSRGISSDGRSPALHAGGRGIDALILQS